MLGSNDLICPADYNRLLCGAIVKVYLTLSHLDLQRQYFPRSYFTATVQRIVVLQEHIPADIDI
jgi:hypothetical protein